MRCWERTNGSKWHRLSVLMNTIRVVHLKRHPDCHRVDRHTALGNPFDLGSEDQRTTVVRAHKEYLWGIVHHGREPTEAAQQVLRRYPDLGRGGRRRGVSSWGRWVAWRTRLDGVTARSVVGVRRSRTMGITIEII